MPRCTVEQIQAELPALKAGGFKCAVAYLEIELKKRKKAKGKTATNDTPKHRSWREASRKYREVHQKDDASSQSYDRDEGTGGA